MAKKLNRVLATVLTVMMVLSMVSVFAFASETAAFADSYQAKYFEEYGKEAVIEDTALLVDNTISADEQAAESFTRTWDGIEFSFTYNVNAFTTLANAYASANFVKDVIVLGIASSTTANLEISKASRVFSPAWDIVPMNEMGDSFNAIASNGKDWTVNTAYSGKTIEVKNLIYTSALTGTAEVYGFAVNNVIGWGGVAGAYRTPDVNNPVTMKFINGHYKSVNNAMFYYVYAGGAANNDTVVVKNVYFDKTCKNFSYSNQGHPLCAANTVFDGFYMDITNISNSASIQALTPYIANDVTVTFKNSNIRGNSSKGVYIASGSKNTGRFDVLFENNVLWYEASTADFLKPYAQYMTSYKIKNNFINRSLMTRNVFLAYYSATPTKLNDVEICGNVILGLPSNEHMINGNNIDGTLKTHNNYIATGARNTTIKPENVGDGSALAAAYANVAGYAPNKTATVAGEYSASSINNYFYDYAMTMSSSAMELAEGDVTIGGAAAKVDNDLSTIEFAIGTESVAKADFTNYTQYNDKIDTEMGTYKSTLVKPTVTIKNLITGATVDTVDTTTAGMYTLTLAYEGYATKSYSLNVGELNAPYFTHETDGYVDATGTIGKNAVLVDISLANEATGTEVIKVWEGNPYTFIVGTNAFGTYTAAETAATAAGGSKQIIVTGWNGGAITVTKAVSVYSPNWNTMPFTRDAQDGEWKAVNSDGKDWTENTDNWSDVKVGTVTINNAVTGEVAFYGFEFTNGIALNAKRASNATKATYKFVNNKYNGTNATMFHLDYGSVNNSDELIVKNFYVKNSQNIMPYEHFIPNVTFDGLYFDVGNLTRGQNFKFSANNSTFIIKNSYLYGTTNYNFQPSVNGINTVNSRVVAYENNVLKSNQSRGSLYMEPHDATVVTITGNYIDKSTDTTNPVLDSQVAYGSRVSGCEVTFENNKVVGYTTGKGVASAITNTFTPANNFVTTATGEAAKTAVGIEFSDNNGNAGAYYLDYAMTRKSDVRQPELVFSDYADFAYDAVNETVDKTISLTAPCDLLKEDLDADQNWIYTIDLSKLLVSKDEFGHMLNAKYLGSDDCSVTDTINIFQDKFVVTSANPISTFNFEFVVAAPDQKSQKNTYNLTISYVDSSRPTFANDYEDAAGIINKTAFIVNSSFATANEDDLVVAKWGDKIYYFTAQKNAFGSIEAALEFAKNNNKTNVQILVSESEINTQSNVDINVTYPCEIFTTNYATSPYTTDGNGVNSESFGAAWAVAENYSDCIVNDVIIGDIEGAFKLYGATIKGNVVDNRTKSATIAFANVVFDNTAGELELKNHDGDKLVINNVYVRHAKDNQGWLFSEARDVEIDGLFIKDGVYTAPAQLKADNVVIKNAKINDIAFDTTSLKLDANVIYTNGDAIVNTTNDTVVELTNNYIDAPAATKFFAAESGISATIKNNIINGAPDSVNAENKTTLNNYAVDYTSDIKTADIIGKELVSGEAYALDVTLAYLSNKVYDPTINVSYNIAFDGTNITVSGDSIDVDTVVIPNKYNKVDYDAEASTITISSYDGTDTKTYNVIFVEPVHNWGELTKVGDATCQHGVPYERECKGIGCTYNGEGCTETIIEYVGNPLTEHSYTNYEHYKDATCSSYAEDRAYCDWCNTAYDTKVRVDLGFDPSVHTFGDYEYYKDATCVSPAQERAICTGCGEPDVRDVDGSQIDPDAHTFETYEFSKAATCVEGALETAKCIYYDGVNCTGTHTRVIAGSEVDTVNGHSFKNPYSNGDATCVTDGTLSKDCRLCGQTHDAGVDVGSKDNVAHTWGDWTYPNVTCGSWGMAHRECEVEGCTEYQDANIANNQPIRVPHSFGEYVYNNDATCYKDGTKSAKCTVCGAIDTEKDDKHLKETVAHNWSEWKVVVAATCTKNAIITRECLVDRCYVTETIEQPNSTIPHSYGKYEYNNDATHESDGTKTAKCTVCGASDTKVAIGTKVPEGVVIIVDTTKVFTDVKADNWFKTYVDYAYSHGIFKGYTDTTYSPDTNLTRAQIVQVFANLAGVDTSDKDVYVSFSDVNAGEWYAPAIKWATEVGIVSGMGNGTFAPNADVTREQMCVMLVNYIEKCQGKTIKVINSNVVFADDAAISSWAKTAVYKCAGADLVKGVGDNKFAPLNLAARSHAATLFTKFHKEYVAQ